MPYLSNVPLVSQLFRNLAFQLSSQHSTSYGFVYSIIHLMNMGETQSITFLWSEINHNSHWSCSQTQHRKGWFYCVLHPPWETTTWCLGDIWSWTPLAFLLSPRCNKTIEMMFITQTNKWYFKLLLYVSVKEEHHTKTLIHYPQNVSGLFICKNRNNLNHTYQ